MLRERRAPRLKKADSRSLPREIWRLSTSRSPISREANCEVPPFSLAEQRRTRLFPQFSTSVWASCSVGTGYLRSRLKSEDTAAAKFPQPRQCILEAVNRAQCIEFIDDKPQPLIAALGLAHGLEYGEVHPSGDHRAQCGDLAGAIRNEQHAGMSSVLDPIAH